MRLKIKLLAAGMLLATGVSTAQAQIYKMVLSGANEIPAATTSGSGTAILAINTTTHQMRLRANFANLTGTTTASHIHCCVVQPANAGVATTTPTFVGFPLGVTSGSWDNTYNMNDASTWNPAFVTANGGTPAGAEAAFVAGVVAGNRSYLNIHSSTFPGGEIRGAPVLFSFVPAATAQGISAAVALDSLGAGTGALTDQLLNLASATSAVQAAAIERLLPTASFASQVVIFNNVTTTFDQLGARLQGLRREFGSGAPVSAVAAGSGGFWVKAVNIDGEQDLGDGFAGFENEGWDLAAGIEHQLDEGLTIGLAFNHTDNSLDYKDQLIGNTSDISSNQLSLYGNHAMGNAYVEAMIAYARHEYEDLRNAGIAGAAFADSDGETWAGRFGAGLTTQLSSSVAFTAQARIDWGSTEQDAYTERGDAALALRVASQSSNRIRTSIGGQLDLGNGGVRPFARAFWNHEFDNDGDDIDASFVAGGTSFITRGQEFEKDNLTLGVGVNFYSQGNFSAAVAYDAMLGGDYESNVVHAKAYWAF